MRALLLAGMATLGWTNFANAALVFDFEQVGANVTASGSGTINTTGLSSFSSDGPIGVYPSSRYMLFGTPTSGGRAAVKAYDVAISGPSFGSGPLVLASSTGDVFGFSVSQQLLGVPTDYVSGAQVSNVATFANQSFSTLGLNLGTYVYSVGAGANADSITVQIGPTAVPEPASLALLSMGVVGMAAARRHRAG